MQVADAEELTLENLRLRRAVHELTILNDLVLEIGAEKDFQKSMDTLVRRSIDELDAEQGVITRVDFDSGPTDAWLVTTVWREIANSSRRAAFRPEQQLLGWMFNNRRPLRTDHPHGDPRLRGINLHQDVRSLLCVPLQVRARLIGVITLYNKRTGGGFTQEDERLLSIIGSQSAHVIEHQRLREEELQLDFVNHEMEVAAEVQRSLLPQSTLRLGDYDVCGATLTARPVGGDYFDYIPIDGNRVIVCLGDVMGKGLSAALLMASLQTAVRINCTLSCLPDEVVSRANRHLVNAGERKSLVTFFYSLLDYENHRLFYCNGGHNYPLFFSREGPVRSLETGGMVLGFKTDCTYSQDSCEFGPGDFLVIYSDGIIEASNGADEEFGVERVIQACVGSNPDSARGILDSIMQAVADFSVEKAPSDDRTLVVVKRYS